LGIARGDNAGIGGSMDLKKGDSDIVPIIPLGIGLQTQLKPGVNLEVSLGYNLANSDYLDGVKRITDDNMNTFTGEAQDGFYNLSVGLAYHSPDSKVKKAKAKLCPEQITKPRKDAQKTAASNLKWNNPQL
jgi:hypothetical protein